MKSQLFICMVLILSVLASPAYAGCGRWVVRDNTDFLKDPIFDDAVASSTGSSATVNPDGTPKAKNETAENSNKTATGNVAAKKVPSIDLAGKWKVLLEDTAEKQESGKTIDLILIQNGDRLQGYGTILEDANDTPATATGTISDEGISLDVKLVQQQRDYKLDMAMVRGMLQGSYELYEMEALAENGNATASRSKS